MSDTGLKECTLEEILEAREDRVRRREALQKKTRCPVISMTMNIPGTVKDSPLLRRTFGVWLELILKEFKEYAVCAPEVRYPDTGPECLWAVRFPVRELKKRCVEFEGYDPAGRLVDIDVCDEDGEAVSRTDLGFPERDCLVCGAPGRACAARQIHRPEDVRAEAERRMREFFRLRDPIFFGAVAAEALIREANVTPKPGLVDRRNNGSHRDMDLALMEKSACALAPYFEECMRIGIQSAAETPDETFWRLNIAGREAEETMFRTTGRVNTHKGAIYLFGIVLGALGRLWHPDRFPEAEEILREGGRIAGRSADEALSDAAGIPEEERTAGQRIFLRYGLRGVRGEAADGFPSIRETALPYLRAHEGEENVWPNLLLHLIALGKDTNLIARGGMDGAEEAVAKVHTLLLEGEVPETEIEALDDWFIERNLSPGGSADLLAVSIFLTFLDQISREEFG